MFTLLASPLLLLSSLTSSLALPQAATQNTVDLSRPQDFENVRQNVISHWAPSPDNHTFTASEFIPLGPEYPVRITTVVARSPNRLSFFSKEVIAILTSTVREQADYLYVLIDDAAPLNEDAITHLFERICGYIIDRKQAIPERIETTWRYVFFNEGYYLGYHRVGESYTFLLEKFAIVSSVQKISHSLSQF